MAFASNLLGAMVGGALEYLALITGYQALLLVVAVLYVLAWLFATRFRRLADRDLVAGARAGRGGRSRRRDRRDRSRGTVLGRGSAIDGLRHATGRQRRAAADAAARRAGDFTPVPKERRAATVRRIAGFFRPYRWQVAGRAGVHRRHEPPRARSTRTCSSCSSTSAIPSSRTWRCSTCTWR